MNAQGSGMAFALVALVFSGLLETYKFTFKYLFEQQSLL